MSSKLWLDLRGTRELRWRMGSSPEVNTRRAVEEQDAFALFPDLMVDVPEPGDACHGGGRDGAPARARSYWLARSWGDA